MHGVYIKCSVRFNVISLLLQLALVMARLVEDEELHLFAVRDTIVVHSLTHVSQTRSFSISPIPGAETGLMLKLLARSIEIICTVTELVISQTCSKQKILI